MQLIWLNVSLRQLDRLNLLLKDIAKLRPHTRAEADLSFSRSGGRVPLPLQHRGFPCFHSSSGS